MTDTYTVFWLPSEAAVDICNSSAYLDRLKTLREQGLNTQGTTKLGEGERAYADELAEVQCASLGATALHRSQTLSGHRGKVRVNTKSCGNGTHITTVSPDTNN